MVKSVPLAATTTARTPSSEEISAIATGSSSKNDGPIALRASGRSSHTVATWPSLSIRMTRSEDMLPH